MHGELHCVIFAVFLSLFVISVYINLLEILVGGTNKLLDNFDCRRGVSGSKVRFTERFCANLRLCLFVLFFNFLSWIFFVRIFLKLQASYSELSHFLWLCARFSSVFCFPSPMPRGGGSSVRKIVGLFVRTFFEV